MVSATLLNDGAEARRKPELRNEGIRVVLKDGEERTVSKDELQFFIVTRQVLFFERSDGWIVCGRDNNAMRKRYTEFDGKDRRKHTVYDSGYWY